MSIVHYNCNKCNWRMSYPKYDDVRAERSHMRLKCDGVVSYELSNISVVNHPSHYGGDTTYEVIKVIEAWGFDKDFHLGNTLKCIARSPHKGAELQDLEKAKWYLERKIAKLKERQQQPQQLLVSSPQPPS